MPMMDQWQENWRTCAAYRQRHKTRKTLRIQRETLNLPAFLQEASLSKTRTIFHGKAINFTDKSRILRFGIGTEKFCKNTLKKNQTITTKSGKKCLN